MRKPKMEKPFVGAGILATLALFTLASAMAGQYTVDRKADWERWSYPGGGVVEITPDGWVEVKSVEKNINACLDASTYTYVWRDGRKYTGGIRGAKLRSNPSDAPNVIDGDTTTFWAPDPEDPLEKWVIEIDLGRLVSATKIRLIFAADRQPFPEFKIYTSEGIEKYVGTRLKLLDYELVWQTVRPNTQHVFELELDPGTDLHGDPLVAKYLQYVKIFFTKKVADAGLAEVEVITLGKNIALGTFDRGGWIRSGSPTPPTSNIFDGLAWTHWMCSLYGDDWLPRGSWFIWDLGCAFWVDTIRMTCKYRKIVNCETFFEGFRMYISDGTPALRSPAPQWRVDGKDVRWERIADVNNKLVLPPLLNHDITLSPPRRVRYIFLHHFYGTGYYATRGNQGAMLFEMQLFGQGMIPGVTLTSPLIDVGKTVNLTSVSWDADTPPGTSIEVRTKTGERVREITRYYDKMGNEMTEEMWKKRPPSLRGPVVIDTVAVAKYWSPWSSPYLRSGERFLSPSPRRYLQLEVELLSQNPEAVPSLNSITLSFSPPAIGTIYSEITPQRVPQAGIPQTFCLTLRMPEMGTIHWYNRWNKEISETQWDRLSEYQRGKVVQKIRRFYDQEGNEITEEEWLELVPELRGESEVVEQEITGFNRVLVETPSLARKVELRIGGEKTEPEEVETKEDSLLVTLPRFLFTEEDSVEIQFECIPFLNSTVFETFVSGLAGSWQRVDPDPAVKSATTVALPALAEEERLISNLKIEPRTISPDGDGVNDIMNVSFTVVKVSKPRQVSVKIYSLGGDLVRTVYGQAGTTGNYGGITWDGKDSSGHRVIPGLYLCVIKVSGDAGIKTVNKTISVAY